MKRRLASLVLAVVMAAVMIAPASAAAPGSGITVKLPGFKVTLNGVTVDNAYLEYPLLVYNDITYFPMTYNFSRFLGVETDWRGSAEGLWLEETGVTAAYNPTARASKNASGYTAAIPVFPVGVNGRLIDNASAKYPFFVFRDVTYCPLTWEYCVGDFNWSYSFSGDGGLVINSANPFVAQYKLPSDIAAVDSGYFALTSTSTHFYYNDGAGNIRQAPLGGGASKVVYELPITYITDDYVYPTLYTEDDEAYLSYHLGNASLGSPHLVRFNADGTYEETSKTRSAVFTNGEVTVTFPVAIGVTPGTIIVGRGEEYTMLGDPDNAGGLRYGSGAGYHVEFYGSDFYVTAAENGKTGLYRVSIDTLEPTLAVDRAVTSFRLEGGTLWYYDGSFYSYNLTTGTETLIRDTAPVGEFEVLGGVLYWTGSTGMLYSSDSEASEWFRASNCYVASTMELKDGYMLFTFGSIPPEEGLVKYRIAAIDAEKNVAFKTSDHAWPTPGLSYDNGRLSYLNADTMTWCVADLG